MRSVLFLATLAALSVPTPHALAETATEKAMAQQIGRDLEASGQLRNYRIGVKYQNGVVWLGGNVSNAGQRETAVRLTQQMEGVSRVVCQLQCPTDAERASQAPNVFNALDNSQPLQATGGPSPVVQAFANTGATRAQPVSTAARMSPPMPRPFAATGRGNMPMPAQRSAVSSVNPNVRQASTQGAYQAAAGQYADGGVTSAYANGGGGMGGAGAVPAGFVPHGMGRGASSDNPSMPGYAWPSYASYPNYAALTYPQQYSPTAWPYIGPFYPYPQVPLAWRKVSLEWDDGWWFLDFSAHNSSH